MPDMFGGKRPDLTLKTTKLTNQASFCAASVAATFNNRQSDN
jgi:hypothetical protein